MKHSSKIFITPLTFSEFGQILDSYYERKGYSAIRKLCSKLKEKSETYEQMLEPMDMSLDDLRNYENVRWVHLEAANGKTLALSQLEGDIPGLTLPENLAQHISNRKPVLITQWW
ncbi:TPA: hypothetical protein U1C94_000755 [Streptococcus suis]|nr:hypothetical protein [Streptococcus suis]